jgi:hypothetical protein
MNEPAEILVARQEQSALGGGFSEDGIVHERRIGFRRVRDVEAGGALCFCDLPINPSSAYSFKRPWARADRCGRP